ncbi:MAG: DUF3035 domain-containing protein [Alphaproteobacteria bacterium]|nr:DUF3035 domain-containing protein [Alphaproteobacteria bacterium]MBV9062273.1 DUF3035 domain-containing protein [Alphaproteobacteria bacterium]
MWSDGLLRLVPCFAACLALSLSACESIRTAVGANKQPPDEFAVVTKAPLIIPPDYNLRPPKPGAPPLNQVSPTDSAEAALFSDDPRTVAGTISGSYSPAEKMLLAQTGAAAANDSIRQQIAADNSGADSADEGFVNSLLFGSNNVGDAPVDADGEKARIDAGKQQAPQIKKDSGGWLDGIF